VFLVKLDGGWQVKATASHQFHVWSDDTKDFHPCELSALSKGNYLRVFIDGNSQNSAEILSIEPIGNETTYDLYEPTTDTWITNGIVSRGCGEQWLGPYENCCLGSLNLAKLQVMNGVPDWEMLGRWVDLATWFLDDVVTANAYVPAVPQLAEAALNVRRIGLGIMGLADLLFKLNIRYGSDRAADFSKCLVEFIRYRAIAHSVHLAKVFGPFPALASSIYSPSNFRFVPPAFTLSDFFGRPALDWPGLVNDIKQHGIRNGAQMTIAPTGTIATVAGCEGYGCEPVFALAYKRHVNDKGQDLVLNYMSPLFERALQDYGLTQAEIDQICKEVAETGSCQHVVGVPPAIKNVFVCSSDISPIEHVKMQAALQTAIDNSISKTINMPETATVQDVKNVYYTAWHMGCKGLTVYVTGSREKVVLETNKTSTSKVEPELTASDEKITRPEILTGKTIKLDTPLGTIFVTVNEDQYGPFEAFLVSAKAGSETTAISEAIGRLISLVLRMNSSISRRSRLQEIVRQLRGIGGSNHVGFGPRKVKSLPDGIAIALEKYLDDPAVQQLAETLPSKKLDVNICPECGDASLVLEEGCEKCRNCGYSKC
jgi:ribonucleoside-diphosphate reductase alpha chain